MRYKWQIIHWHSSPGEVACTVLIRIRSGFLYWSLVTLRGPSVHLSQFVLPHYELKKKVLELDTFDSSNLIKDEGQGIILD